MVSYDSYPLLLRRRHGPPRDLRAGAAGFEPAIPGPKPGALPLGHAPERGRLLQDRPHLPRLYRSLYRLSAFDKRLDELWLIPQVIGCILSLDLDFVVETHFVSRLTTKTPVVFRRLRDRHFEISGSQIQ